jgi:hypothetical protein
MDFGRRSISSIKQILKSKILDIGKEDLYKKYKDRVGEIIVGEVYQILRKEVIMMMKVVNYFYLSPNKYHQIFLEKATLLEQ